MAFPRERLLERTSAPERKRSKINTVMRESSYILPNQERCFFYPEVVEKPSGYCILDY